MAGKLPVEMLRKYVFARTGAPDPDVLVGPSYGEDAAIINLGGKVLVIHADPITGAVEKLGWLAVNVACNDIAVRGAKPRWLVQVLLLPEGCGEELIDRITKQVDEAARELGVAVVGGHSEYTAGLGRPMITMTAVGVAEREKYVTTGGARPGDALVMTKTAGVEGTAILATDFADALLRKGIEPSLVRSGAGFIKRISVVREALKLAEVGVHAMHDPTEGGVLGGLAEIAYSSNVLVRVWEDRIPVAKETAFFCRALRLDPLKLISSGVLLAAVPPDRLKEAVEELSTLGIKASVIGRVEEGQGLLLHRSDGSVERIGEYVAEELMRLWDAEKL